jgi:hypothetical protein
MSLDRDAAVEERLRASQIALEDGYLDGAAADQLRDLATLIDIGKSLRSQPQARWFQGPRLTAVAIVLAAAFVVSLLYSKRIGTADVVVDISTEHLALTARQQLSWAAPDRRIAPQVESLKWSGSAITSSGGVSANTNAAMRFSKPKDAHWLLNRLGGESGSKWLLEAGSPSETHVLIRDHADVSVDLGGDPTQYPQTLIWGAGGREKFGVLGPVLSTSGETIDVVVTGTEALVFPQTSLSALRFTEPHLVDAEVSGNRSTIHEARLAFPGFEKRSLDFGEGATMEISDFAGTAVVSRNPDKPGFRIHLTGTVSEIRTGLGASLRSAKPSLLEWIMQNHTLAAFWSAFAWLLAIVWSVRKALTE